MNDVIDILESQSLIFHRPGSRGAGKQERVVMIDLLEDLSRSATVMSNISGQVDSVSLILDNGSSLSYLPSEAFFCKKLIQWSGQPSVLVHILGGHMGRAPTLFLSGYARLGG
jgi:hypothetical protein